MADLVEKGPKNREALLQTADKDKVRREES